MTSPVPSQPAAPAKGAHTPGEWIVSAESPVRVVSVRGEYICFAGYPRTVDETKLDGESWLSMRERTAAERKAVEDETCANAALIVRAVNSHAELVSALRELLQYLDDHAWGHVPEGAVADKARAALAKAGER